MGHKIDEDYIVTIKLKQRKRYRQLGRCLDKYYDGGPTFETIRTKIIFQLIKQAEIEKLDSQHYFK